MGTSSAEREAMARALALAATPGVPFGPNPRVGCVLLDDDGRVVAEGLHRGAGTAHAEVDALSQVDDALLRQGLTAVVTLEPCDHTGRTGPCSEALLTAGVRRVVHALPDPTEAAGGGARRLREAGVEVECGLMAEEATRLNRGWLHGLRHGRPFVTWKLATSLDGRSAAADGTSRWVSNAASRRDTHRLRGLADVMMAGTGTVLTDGPRLNVRDEHDRPLPRQAQPLRVVVGERPLPGDAAVLDDSAATWVTGTRDLSAVLTTLFEQGRREVFLEGGPTLAGAFLAAGLVDEVVAYVAPLLIGDGIPAAQGLPFTSITDALRLDVLDVTTIGAAPETDVRLTMRPHEKEA
ncbi:bifunctional diaminohydroxyphosphoribosylaminopyrimidine deaminase/5-amino-6-(5-phosphoribosylamino)uracil reductase RibD [Nocardioides marmoribigeumensis]|uniref:Riboflavin biosynthesis protein RibD n=1 Tax=Nocardioides marmoribigeumensis TaxID=433649 RepID=A0ABU2BQQ6_9ACTN|nr:bifunctional diaminohydroxyphosphoribosylaminopyrimidine deaminase/5-amino-6-(5-phosphoribosylamino)uracil reductase RibD [Nocardioides marmoribigeumensis]MDR7360977.1 diaminohydroxyphosphoribosylaminopyrimidine deaminase/5-amino-6-(5-phosphoribosylamino)uracil reductase [Nocardioides marmoribigeumensis]